MGRTIIGIVLKPGGLRSVVRTIYLMSHNVPQAERRLCRSSAIQQVTLDLVFCCGSNVAITICIDIYTCECFGCCEWGRVIRLQSAGGGQVGEMNITAKSSIGGGSGPLGQVA